MSPEMSWHARARAARRGPDGLTAAERQAVADAAAAILLEEVRRGDVKPRRRGREPLRRCGSCGHVRHTHAPCPTCAVLARRHEEE